MDINGMTTIQHAVFKQLETLFPNHDANTIQRVIRSCTKPEFDASVDMQRCIDRLINMVPAVGTLSTGEKKKSTSLSAIQKEVMSHLSVILPKHSSKAIKTSVCHPNNLFEPLASHTLIQRCIDDLLEGRTALEVSDYCDEGQVQVVDGEHKGCCDECQMNNHLCKVPSNHHPIPPPDASFEQFGMDLVGPFNIHLIAKEKITDAQILHKRYYDQRRKDPTYAVGDKVCINNPKRINRKGDKPVRRWHGPYDIVSVEKKGTYRLGGLKSLVNACHMKPYRSRPTMQDGKTNGQTESTCDFSNTKEMFSVTVADPKKDERRKLKTPKRKSVSREKLNTMIKTEFGLNLTKDEQTETILFNAVDKDWQKKRAKCMDLVVKRDIPSCVWKEISILEPPSDQVTIRGDGNCYFRTISHILTGDQNDHSIIRKRVCEYTKNNNKQLSIYSQSKDYAGTSMMSVLGEWGTEVENLATASMLGTNICVYCPYGRDGAGNSIYKWVTYRPLSGLSPLNGLRMSRKNIYISNLSEHYVPVYQI